MKLWFIHQSENQRYDTYDSAVVAAETEEEARLTHPGGDRWNGKKWVGQYSTGDWTDPINVQVRYLGEAKEGTDKGAICASFNAG